jgi:general secretion pathway protein D
MTLLELCSPRLTGRFAAGCLWLIILLAISGCDPYQSGLLVKEKKATAGELLKSDPTLTSISDETRSIPAHNANVLKQRPRSTPIAGTREPKGRGILQEMPLGQLAPGQGVGSAAFAGNQASASAEAAGGQQAPAERTQVSLDFADVSLRELVQVLFEEYLKVPYTILDGFKDKKVNFVYQAVATREEMLVALDAFLSFHGVSLTYSGGVYAITTESNKLKGQPAVDDLGSVAGVFQLTYLDAKEFLNIARQFIDQPTQALDLGGNNAIFVYAPSAQFKAVQMLHERLDVPYFEGKYLIVYAPKFLSPSALKVLIENYEKMLNKGASKGARMFEVEAVKELSRVVIVAADLNARNLVVQFLNANDDLGGNERQIFQYILTNQKAGEMVVSMKGLIGVMFDDEERAEVIADKSSNSLFISATAEDFAEIIKLINRLDYRPPAVHIDVTLAEVVLNDSMKYGVEWFLFGTSGNNRASAQMDLGQGLDKGLVLDFVNLANDKFITLELLASETDFKILANPQMVVKNGSSATIVVGSEIAIEKATLETNTAGSSAKTEFERRDVAIRVEATPTIGADQQIQIALRVVDERDIGRDINGQPIFAKRELKTELVAYDGETLFMGGIIRNRSVSEKDKIPLAGDLKYVGEYLFGNRDFTQERTELIMLVTPRLLLDNEGANILTNALVGATLARLDDEDKR